MFFDSSNNAVVKEYKLLDAGQATAAGRGESRGITPMADFSPVDGMIWYSKLNGNRLDELTRRSMMVRSKWNPPFRGPRRLRST